MSANNFLSYAGWAVLPNLISGWIQSLYYSITIRAGDPKPQPGTPRYQKHRKRIHVTVIVAYLLYTMYEADYWVRRDGNFYEALGVLPGAEEKQIRSRFRRLAAIHHPDKASSGEDQAAVDAYFVSLKTAQDTLSDPLKRFAYERFGPDMLKWQHCKTVRDYLVVGFQANVPIYAGSVIVFGLLGITGYLQYGQFWRYLTFFSLFLLEYHTLTRAYTTPILSKFVNPALHYLTSHPPLLPFQLLILARKATFTLFIAFSQLGTVLRPATPTGSAGHDTQQLLRLEQVAVGTEAEASRLLALDMAPFVGDDHGVKDLQARMKEWLVTNTIRADPEVRDAIGRAYGRRRMGAPAGARR